MYFFYISQTESTQDHSKALQNLHFFSVTFWVQSGTQMRGRGQRGKKWSSFEGNLFLTGSFLLSANFPPGCLAIAVGVQLAQILKSLVPGQQIGLKWPNDILCNYKKIGGVLIEFEGNRAHIGIGMNVVIHPEDSTMPATHLQCYGDVSMNTLAQEIINNVHVNDFENFQSIQEAWWVFARDTIPYWGISKIISGEITGIDENGQLMIQTPDGKLIKRHQAFDNDLLIEDYQ